MGGPLGWTGIRIAASGIAIAALVTATAAPAQTSTASAPPATRGDAAVLSGDRASMPIRRGMYAAPGQAPLFGGTASSLYRRLRSEPSAVGMAGKADLVWQSKGGHPFSLGVESVGMARQGVTFGGGF